MCESLLGFLATVTVSIYSPGSSGTVLGQNNFGGRGYQVYLVLSNFATECRFFAGQQIPPNLLAVFNGEGKRGVSREWVKQGWNNSGRWGGDGGQK